MKKSGVKKVLAGLSSLCVLAAAMPAASYAAESTGAVRKLYGDANCDGYVNIADAVLVMQVATNPDKYAQGKSASSISAAGEINADVDGKKGLSNSDALLIQKHKLGLIDKFPVEEQTASDYDVEIRLIGKTITAACEADKMTYFSLNEAQNVITITHSGSYRIDGTLEDGQICVNVPDEAADPDTVKLFLNGANITGKSAPAILVSNAENTSINIVDGTENTITDGDTAYASADGTLTGEAVIEAKDDLTIKGGDLGTGLLNITANTQDGVYCKNDLKVNGGVIDVKALNSTDKTNGLTGKKSLTVKSGTLTVDAEGDGIKSKGAVTVSGGSTSIKAGNDAVQSDTTIDISGGLIVAGGDRGFTAVTGVNITGGTVIATATDNQAKNVTAEGQAVMLLNCIDDASNTKDGCWKKNNTLYVGCMDGYTDFTKKYKYVLMSDPTMAIGTEVLLYNKDTNANVTYGAEGNHRFMLESSVNTFDKVDIAGILPVPVPTGSSENTINFNGVSTETSAAADTVTVNGSAVTITKPGTFTVSGEGKEVQIIVDVDKTAYPAAVVELDLSGADLSNSTTAPIYVASVGDEVQIVAKKGTVNAISDGSSHTQTYTDSDGNTNTVEGAVFARDDIKFKGSGTLTVNGNQDDAIVGKNDIKIYNGNLTVNAVDDGIRGKDSVVVGDDVKSDGTPADNSGLVLNVNTKYGDGIKSSSDETADGKTYGNVTINGGTVNIVCEALNADTENSNGADGIQAEQSFVMNGGDVNIKVYKGSEYTGTGTSSSGGQQGGGWGGPGGGFPGGGGFGMDGNANKTVNTAKGIKAVGLYESDGTTYKSGGTITINGGNLTVDSSDDCVHCAGEMQLNGGNLVLKSADDGLHSDTTLSIGKTAANTFDDVVIYIPKCYEGVEAVTINQNSGTVYIVSGDDGYNAAGGNDSSGSEPGQGGRPGWGSSNFAGAMNLNGGFVVVNSASGDHDAFDSNGNINVNGGYYCANGQEPLDCGDGGSFSINKKGGNYITMTAGNTNLTTRYTFVDKSGNVIVSFLSANGNASKTISDSSVSLYTGGTVSGGTALIPAAPDNVYIGGTLSGGSAK